MQDCVRPGQGDRTDARIIERRALGPSADGVSPFDHRPPRHAASRIGDIVLQRYQLARSSQTFVLGERPAQEDIDMAADACSSATEAFPRGSRSRSTGSGPTPSPRLRNSWSISSRSALVQHVATRRLVPPSRAPVIGSTTPATRALQVIPAAPGRHPQGPPPRSNEQKATCIR